VGLIGFDAWWLVRDQWPQPTLTAIGVKVARGNYAEAEIELREHLRRSPHDGEARMTLARSLAARQHMLECAAELHQVPVWWPKKREAQFLEGRSFWEVNRGRDAEAAWRACVADDPLHPTPPEYYKAATEGLLELFAAEGRWEAARELIWATFDQVDPADKESVLIMRLRTEVERIDPATAVARLRSAVAADHGDVDARRALARTEAALGNEVEATRQMRTCLSQRPTDLTVWRDWLGILHNRNDMAALSAELARVPAHLKTDAAIQELEGIVRQSAGDLAGALEAFRAAASSRPDDGEFLYRLGRVEGRLGRAQAARDHLARSKVLRDARTELRDALDDFVAATTPGRTAPVDRRTATARLAATCRTLGMIREARALEAM
jgi:Flp pilus assembly protein TadD